MRILFLALLACSLFAQNISDILYSIEVKNDLSQKTKEENGGISYIFTRLDMDALQIRSLHDILRLTPLTEKFNRYGLFDPYNPDSLIPFLSTYIKIYLNDHELGGVLYGSGLAILGDLDLGFVDHVEVYTQAPSLEVSTEPSIIIIKLYTKRAERDEGTSLFAQKGSKNSSLVSLSHGKVFTSNSLYIYGARQKKGFAHPLGLDRDFTRSHALLSLYTKDQEFLFYGSSHHRGGFIGPSLDAKLSDSQIHTKFIHLHYLKKFHGLSFKTTFENMINKTHFNESPILTYINRHPLSDFATHSHSFQATFDLSYKYESTQHALLMGAKYKYKHQKFDYIKINYEALPPGKGPNNQKIYQLYAQESFYLTPNSVFNAGIAMDFVKNESNIDDYWIRLYRLGHTFLKDNWTFKSNYAHIEYHIDPYLMNSFFVTQPDLPSTKVDNIFEDIKYSLGTKQQLELVGGYLRGRNYIFPNRESKLYTVHHSLSTLYCSFQYDWSYRPFSKLRMLFSYEKINHIPLIGSYKFNQFILSHYHPLKDFIFFEEIFVSKFDHSAIRSDMTVGVKYHLLSNLDFSLRIDNLFDNTYSYPFRRIDPLTFRPLSTLRVPYNGRRGMISMEWLF